MDASKPKFGDTDADYWRHAKQGVKWDSRCRINHDQPTWYFSFMGRVEKQIEWRNESPPVRILGQPLLLIISWEVCPLIGRTAIGKLSSNFQE